MKAKQINDKICEKPRKQANKSAERDAVLKVLKLIKEDIQLQKKNIS